MNEKTTKEDSNVLKVLFPEREVELADGIIMIQRPLALSDLPKITDSFARVLGEWEKTENPAEVVASSLSELLKMLPYTLDRPWQDVPSTVAPILIENFIDQNINGVVAKNWIALIEKVLDKLGIDQGKRKELLQTISQRVSNSS